MCTCLASRASGKAWLAWGCIAGSQASASQAWYGRTVSAQRLELPLQGLWEHLQACPSSAGWGSRCFIVQGNGSSCSTWPSLGLMKTHSGAVWWHRRAKFRQCTGRQLSKQQPHLSDLCGLQSGQGGGEDPAQAPGELAVAVGLEARPTLRVQTGSHPHLAPGRHVSDSVIARAAACWEFIGPSGPSTRLG